MNTYIHTYIYINIHIYIYIYKYIYIYILAENPPYGQDFQLAPTEFINGAFGPIKFWGLRPQNLFIFLTGIGGKLQELSIYQKPYFDNCKIGNTKACTGIKSMSER